MVVVVVGGSAKSIDNGLEWTLCTHTKAIPSMKHGWLFSLALRSLTLKLSNWANRIPPVLGTARFARISALRVLNVPPPQEHL